MLKSLFNGRDHITVKWYWCCIFIQQNGARNDSKILIKGDVTVMLIRSAWYYWALL